MKRFAFTMMELVFVLIVIGVLTVLAMPSFNRDPLAEATEQLANHIRYTQHLAMVDDRFDATNPQWYSEMWKLNIRQIGTNWFYEVFSDAAPYDGNSVVTEEAIDPLTGKTLGNNGVGITNVSQKYGITNIAFTGGNNTKGSVVSSIAFDNLGRPYRDVESNLNMNWRDFLITTNMVITLTGQDKRQSTITIVPETGYVSTNIPG